MKLFNLTFVLFLALPAMAKSDFDCSQLSGANQIFCQQNNEIIRKLTMITGEQMTCTARCRVRGYSDNNPLGPIKGKSIEMEKMLLDECKALKSPQYHDRCYISDMKCIED